MDKALFYLSLARKAGRIELGEEPVGAAARAGKARLVIAAADASDHTWRRAKSFVAGTDQICVKIPFSKDQLGQAVGRQSLALAALTDPALALSFLQALSQPEAFRQEQEALEGQVKRLAQRKQEQKAHRRNVRLGKGHKKK